MQVKLRLVALKIIQIIFWGLKDNCVLFWFERSLRRRSQMPGPMGPPYIAKRPGVTALMLITVQPQATIHPGPLSFGSPFRRPGPAVSRLAAAPGSAASTLRLDPHLAGQSTREVPSVAEDSEAESSWGQLWRFQRTISSWCKLANFMAKLCHEIIDGGGIVLFWFNRPLRRRS